MLKWYCDNKTGFMVNRSMMKQSLLWLNRVNPETKNTVDFATYILMTAVYFRCAYGFLDWRWIYGHTVT